MNCPKCNAEMEVGGVCLKADCFVMLSQAKLEFEKDTLWTDYHVPLSGLFGRRNERVGYRCNTCHLVTIEWERQDAR